MGWTLTHLQEARVLVVTTSGRMNLQDLVQMASDAMVEAGVLKVRKFLIDHRRMTADVSSMDVYDLPSVIRRLGLQPSHTAAIVFAAETARPKDVTFYEDVSHELGQNVRVFTDPADALAWLGSVDERKG